MVVRINLRNLVGTTVLSLAVAISIPPFRPPARSSLASPRIVDSSGRTLSSVYYGLLPDPAFANQLKLIRARTKKITRDSSFRFRTLKYRVGNNPDCGVSATALRVPAAPPRVGCPCNGQYMQPQYFDCDLGCGGTVWEQFFSNGNYPPCSGYYYDDSIIGDCNGCELAERSCNSCRC